ncbi:MAG: hypothetical protein E7256_01950 [Lachnospiraceae bacterium]|nr:hypothetical protein [Lachnospiraceae bacterium]
MHKQDIMPRITSFLLGILTLYFGVALGIPCKIGVGTNDALSLTLQNITKLPLGIASISISTLFLLLQILIAGKNFKKKEFFQMGYILFGGFLLNLFTYHVVNGIVIRNTISGISLYLISIVVKAVGVSFILQSDIVMTPLEGLCTIIADRMSVRMGTIRQLADVVFISAILILGFTIHSDITVGIGTVLDLIFFGPVLNLLEQPINTLLFKEKNNEQTNLSQSNLTC